MAIVHLVYERPSASEALCALAERILVDRGEISDVYRKGVHDGVHAHMARIFQTSRSTYFRRSTGHAEAVSAREGSIRTMLEAWKAAGYPEIEVTISATRSSVAEAKADLPIVGREGATAPDVEPGEDLSELLEDIGMIPHRALLPHQFRDLAAHPNASDAVANVVEAVLRGTVSDG